MPNWLIVVAIGIALYIWYKHKEKCAREAARREQVERLMSDPMSKHYQPPDWKFRRAYILRRDDYRCRKCGSADSLHVHHIVHRSERCDHSKSNLITLCNVCHGKEHGIRFETSDEIYERNQEASRKRRLLKFARSGTTVRARKSHVCAVCDGVIKPGDSYIKVTSGDYKISIRNQYPGGASICENCVYHRS